MDDKDKKSKIDILVLDDSALALKMIGRLLEKGGYSFILESNPAKGLETIEEKLPRVVFIDYLMPGCNGDDVAIKFSELMLFKYCSLNLLSSKDFSSTETFSLMTLGFENILKKPLSSEKLNDVLAYYFPEKAKKAA